MIYEFNITVPLTYNKFEILSNNPNAEHCYVFKDCYEETVEEVFKTYEIPGCKEGYDFKNTIKITLQEDLQERETPRLICNINGILFDDDRDAKMFAENIVNKICKRLSLVFIKYNYNRHLSQPRVEPVWSEASCNHSKYKPFLEMKPKTMRILGANSYAVDLDDYLSLRVGVYCVTKTTIPHYEIKLGEWFSNLDDDLEFLVNEYYSALGTENIKSKFFHLFSMVEFCEMKYKDYNGSSRLLSDEEVDKIIVSLGKCISCTKKQKIVSILKNNLIKANDIGRTAKLGNILKWMGIDKYKKFGKDRTIDKECLEELIKLRNESFHGTKEIPKDVEKKYAGAVETLLYIGEKILEYLMQNEPQNKRKEVYFFEGKKEF